MLKQEINELQRQQARASREIRDRIATELRAGRSQRELAAELGWAQPEIHRYATSSAGRDISGRSRRWMTARTAVDAVKRKVADGDDIAALRMLVQALDHLDGLTDPDDIAEWAVTPPPLKDPRFDTLMAALARRAFLARHEPPPRWAHPEPLAEDWVLAAHPARAARVRADTAPDLAALNVFVAERDLVTV